jgi:hypothetical protein
MLAGEFRIQKRMEPPAAAGKLRHGDAEEFNFEPQIARMETDGARNEDGR